MVIHHHKSNGKYQGCEGVYVHMGMGVRVRAVSCKVGE